MERNGRGFLAGLTSASARNLLVILLAIELAFAAVYIVLQVYIGSSSPWVELRHLFDVDQEISLPTWFSTTQLAAVAFLLFVHATERTHLRRAIIFVATIFMFLSLDEGASIHDRLYGMAREQGTFGRAPYFAWMLPYSGIAAVSLFLLWKPASLVYRRAPRETSLVATGATLFLVGGVGLEILSHRVLSVTPKYLPFVLTVAAEEFCEMAGITLALYAFVLLSIRASSRSPTSGARPVDRSIDSTEPRMPSWVAHTSDVNRSSERIVSPFTAERC